MLGRKRQPKMRRAVLKQTIVGNCPPILPFFLKELEIPFANFNLLIFLPSSWFGVCVCVLVSIGTQSATSPQQFRVHLSFFSQWRKIFIYFFFS